MIRGTFVSTLNMRTLVRTPFQPAEHIKIKKKKLNIYWKANRAIELGFLISDVRRRVSKFRLNFKYGLSTAQMDSYRFVQKKKKWNECVISIP